MSEPVPDELELRQLPDSPDARRFVELASCIADVMEAENALLLAQQSIERNGRPDDVSDSLVGFAAVSYCRAFFPSQVRDVLRTEIVVPEEHASLHQLIVDFRNRRVAHSHSHMSSTFALVSLPLDGVRRPAVFAATTMQSLPPTVIDDWMALIDTVIERVGDLQEEVEARLTAQLAELSDEALRALPGLPEITHVRAEDFVAGASRGRYPTSAKLVYTVTPV